MIGLKYTVVIITAIIFAGISLGKAQIVTHYFPKHVNALKDLSQKTEDFVQNFVLRNTAPDFVKHLATLDEADRVSILKDFLREVNSERCREDVLTGFLLMATSLTTGSTPPTWLLQRKSRITYAQCLYLHYNKKMMDSWGKVPSGLLSGNVKSSGDFQECTEMRASYSSLVSYQQNEFRGSYCSIYLVPELPDSTANDTKNGNIEKKELRKAAESSEEFLELMNSPDYVNMIPFLGTCLPSTCSAEDQQIFLSAVFEAVPNNPIVPVVISCQTGEKPEYSGGAVAMILALITIGLLCILGTVMDLRRRQKPSLEIVETKSGRVFKLLEKVLISFSVYTNAEKVLKTSTGTGSLGCIHGLRFLSMAWVVCGHTLYLSALAQTWNSIDLKKIYSKNWPVMALLNATVSVDTFFVMSGLLVSYNTLRELDKTKGFAQFAFMKVPFMYIQRYLRLTPTYLILLGIVATLLPYFSSSPYWYIIDSEAEVCAEKWWHNILYINNIVDAVPGSSMCYGDSWYLANDMQFFILSPFIIYPLWASKRIGVILLGGLSLGTIFANFYITRTKNLTPTSIPNMRMLDYQLHLYMKPWTRAGPYLVGIFVGYLLYKALKSKSAAKKMPSWIVTAGWMLSTITALAIVFGPYDLFDPKNENASRNSLRALLYAGLHRYVWACVIGWIIYACVQGQGGIVNRILSWEVFIPLGRLTYCIYIASYHMQVLYHVTLMHPTHFSMYIMMHNFFAHLFFQLLIGFFLTVTIESPFLNLTKLLFR